LDGLQLAGDVAVPLQQSDPKKLSTSSLTRSAYSVAFEPAETAWLLNPDNIKRYAAYRFDGQPGGGGGTAFNDAESLQQKSPPVPSAAWPNKIVLERKPIAGGQNEFLLTGIGVYYEAATLLHNLKNDFKADDPNITQTTLAANDRVTKMVVGIGVRGDLPLAAVEYLELEIHRGDGKVTLVTIGVRGTKQTFEYKPFDGMKGLKGFWGGAGFHIDRLGAIWGS
jgi:hypothetical protein